jgi:hypothetical protein
MEARASLEFEGALFLLWFLTDSVQGNLILARDTTKSKKAKGQRKNINRESARTGAKMKKAFVLVRVI